MHRSRSIPLLLAVTALALAAPAASASTTPGAVSVRVEGIGATLLPATQASTTGSPMTKDGNPAHSCPGTSALAALNTATAGNWDGPWNSSFSQYEVLTIAGETHLFEPGAEANYFWSFWLDEHESFVGACEAEVQPGDRVLFFPACFGSACPPPQLPLGVEAPAVASVGEAIDVIVKRYSAEGEAVPEPGATISGGSAPATTDSGGRASVSFSAPGTYALAVSAPESVRTETTVTVLGAGQSTTESSSSSSAGGGSQAGNRLGSPAAYKGPFALVAKLGGLAEGHVYSRRSAPRLLAGTILSHAAVNSVAFELRRSYRHRCFAYDGVRERFRKAACGSGSAFKIAGGGAFSYLLPAALGPGRYVLDITATDVAGNRTTLARGSSRLVFYVR